MGNNMRLRIGVGLFCVIGLTGCTTGPIYNGKVVQKSPLSSSFMGIPKHTLSFFLEGMTNQLIESNQFLTESTPLAVTSFVDLQKMNKTNWLGNAVSEGFLNQMQKRGYTLVDYKATGSIQVTALGDFAISRDWRDLEQQQNVDYVLTGTMLHQPGGVLIHARVIGMRSRVVVASAQGFLPMEYIGREVETQYQIQQKEGYLIRRNVADIQKKNT